jgi:group I intron endonuclease
MNFIIYCITCLINDKKYYGQTVKTLEKRWNEHTSDAKRRDGKLQRAFRKHGVENFKIELIETVNTKKEADKRENYYIIENNTMKTGYNMTEGGEGTPGRKDSEEVKSRRNATLKETLKNGFSEEHREKLSIARKKHSGPWKGKKFPEELCNKLSEIHKGTIALTVRKHSKTGVKGVTLEKTGKYKVRIKGKYIGLYSTIEEAKKVHDDKFFEMCNIII